MPYKTSKAIFAGSCIGIDQTFEIVQYPGIAFIPNDGDTLQFRFPGAVTFACFDFTYYI